MNDCVKFESVVDMACVVECGVCGIEICHDHDGTVVVKDLIYVLVGEVCSWTCITSAENYWAIVCVEHEIKEVWECPCL